MGRPLSLMALRYLLIPQGTASYCRDMAFNIKCPAGRGHPGILIMKSADRLLLQQTGICDLQCSFRACPHC